MKTTRFLLIALAAFTLFARCSKYDDSALRNRIDELERRLEDLESLIAQLEAAQKAEVSIVSYSALPNNAGWKIVFTDGSILEVKNGVDGTNGTNGEDGEDGQDGEDGDSFIESIVEADGYVIIRLTNGRVYMFAKHVPESMTIAGTEWSTRNVETRGAFVASPELYGNRFTFEEAQSVCPQGWKTPKVEEFQNLITAGYDEKTIENGVNGRRMGSSAANSIFFPAAGSSAVPLSAGSRGYYWTSESVSSTRAGHMHFYGDSFSGVTATDASDGLSVRCVKEPDIPDGESVIVSGVEWATRNVDVAGKFTLNMEDYGNLFTYADAQTACPEGWTVPWKEALQSLIDSGFNEMSVNGVKGVRFGSDGASIFLPHAGVYNSWAGVYEEQGSIGYYWSSDLAPDNPEIGWMLMSSGYATMYADELAFRSSVRCVRAPAQGE
jgi:uncharacterized protein (TIGR02145 family)